MDLPTAGWARLAFEATLKGANGAGGNFWIAAIPEINQ